MWTLDSGEICIDFKKATAAETWSSVLKGKGALNVAEVAAERQNLLLERFQAEVRPGLAALFRIAMLTAIIVVEPRVRLLQRGIHRAGAGRARLHGRPGLQPPQPSLVAPRYIRDSPRASQSSTLSMRLFVEYPAGRWVRRFRAHPRWYSRSDLPSRAEFGVASLHPPSRHRHLRGSSPGSAAPVDAIAAVRPVAGDDPRQHRRHRHAVCRVARTRDLHQRHCPAAARVDLPAAPEDPERLLSSDCCSRPDTAPRPPGRRARFAAHQCDAVSRRRGARAGCGTIIGVITTAAAHEDARV